MLDTVGAVAGESPAVTGAVFSVSEEPRVNVGLSSSAPGTPQPHRRSKDNRRATSLKDRDLKFLMGVPPSRCIRVLRVMGVPGGPGTPGLNGLLFFLPRLVSTYSRRKMVEQQETSGIVLQLCCAQTQPTK